MKQDNHKLNSVEKALIILKSFSSDHSSWGVRELSAHLGFSPSTVQRLLQTLKESGFTDQDAITRQYRLGSIYFQFVHTLQSTHPISKAALPYMRHLLSKTQETVHLNVIDGMERLCIDNIESSQSLKASMPVGSRSPLYAGASSKCLLAHSDEDFVDHYLKHTKLDAITEKTITQPESLRYDLRSVREKGYAESLGERNPGLGSLSAAILGRRGELLASISLAIPEIRFLNQNHRQKCLNELLETAKEISKTMGHLLQTD